MLGASLVAIPDMHLSTEWNGRCLHRCGKNITKWKIICLSLIRNPGMSIKEQVYFVFYKNYLLARGHVNSHLINVHYRYHIVWRNDV